MSIQFSESTNKSGIVEQTRSMCRVDSTQWPTYKIVNSSNNWHDFVTGYAIGSDKRFQWDDTNHTKLPEGTMNLLAQSDYSFLQDEQGNQIITLTGVYILVNGKFQKLDLVDKSDPEYDPATFGVATGTPSCYDKIADNIIRLDRVPTGTTSGGLKFTFQRTGSPFTTTDTTKTPGVSPLLHRGYIIASSYDCALTLGLDNLQVLANEREIEKRNVVQYFSNRNNDDRKNMTFKKILYK